MPRIVTFSAAVTAAMCAGTIHAQTLTFTNVTTQVGAACSHNQSNLVAPCAAMCSGGAAADFNNDGWMDIFVVSGEQFPDRLFINNGDGTFTDRATEAGVDRHHYGMGIAIGDYDDDGWVDIFINSGGPKTVDGVPQAGFHILYHNNGDGTFTDVANDVGINSALSASAYNGWGAAFGDYDLDGDLDLFIAGWIPDALPSNVLLRNDGDAGFADATDSVCFSGGGGAFDFSNPPTRGFSPLFADMNGDRYPELLIAADFMTSKYFINNGDGTLTEATGASGTGLDGNGMGTTIGDFNNDLRFDWYVTSIFGTPSGDVPGTGNMLYMNNGDHHYTEMGGSAGVKDGGWGWGTAALDANNDGWEDIAETNGWRFRDEWNNEKSYLWLNQGNMTFTEVGLASGLDHQEMGQGLIRLDFDNDGDQDVAIFSHYGPFYLFRNNLQGPGTNYLRLFFDTSADRRIAPGGQGAVVHVSTGKSTQARQVVGGSHFLSQSEMSAHFGLGHAKQADEVLVIWPSGKRTRLREVAANQTLTIRACVADLTGSSDPNSPDYGIGDGSVGVADFLYMLDQFVAGNLAAVDLTGSSVPGDPAYGLPDGVIDLHDFFYFLDEFVSACG
ncbi:MAG: CRTAC1 family protein [Phycisphaeraceae bacterium]|nr:CRTAC1 family protein [Phycisphaeraceae bacterium]